MKQYTIRVDDELSAFIDLESENPFSSANQVICLLLKGAIKERLRKRGTKENNTSDHPSDLSQSNTGG
jgi:hypothetical protein